MTPAERAVIEASLAWRQARRDQRMPMATELLVALDALDAERAAPATTEKELTWGEVAEGDEIFSAKTNRWYEVIEARNRGSRVLIRAKGLPKTITPEVSGSVKVRRGLTGSAVDVINTILVSGPSTTEVTS